MMFVLSAMVGYSPCVCPSIVTVYVYACWEFIVYSAYHFHCARDSLLRHLQPVGWMSTHGFRVGQTFVPPPNLLIKQQPLILWRGRNHLK